MPDQIVCRVLTGPTASGKSELGMRLAEERGLHILCMDSMQIYRRMDIGTAKPGKADREKVPHHLLDLREPDETFSVAEYRDEAEKLILQLAAEGKETLLIGGTVLYLQSLIHPMGMGQVSADPSLRDELRRTAETAEGKLLLHERLRVLDPATAERLPVNDVRRVIRAIEVTEATGIPFSRQPERSTPADSRFEWRIVSTAMERGDLYDRINRRAERMIRLGLRDEVAALLESGVPEDAQSMQGLGYKEMIPCVRGQCSEEEACERFRTGTRHYAKRQITFLKKEESVHYVASDAADALDQIRKILY